jgi:hypothetical protein
LKSGAGLEAGWQIIVLCPQMALFHCRIPARIGARACILIFSMSHNGLLLQNCLYQRVRASVQRRKLLCTGSIM